MTLFQLIEAQAARLKQAGVAFGHGTTNAFDEAAWLVLWAIGLPIDKLEDHAQRAATADETAKAEAIVGRRIAERIPAAYLTGEAWLQNVPFFVDPRSIVPRSYIAELLADGEGEGLLDAWLTERTQHVLDLCTGNGSLAVIGAMAFPEMAFDAADLSAEALEVARRNVARHRLDNRITLHQADLFGSLPGPWDLILCNPPYVNAQSMAKLPPEYRAEPEMALAGGADGMDLVRRILRDAPSRMSADAVLVLEIGHERRHFERAFPKLEFAWLPTSGGDDKVLVATREALARLP